jgi:hypothetical protein
MAIVDRDRGAVPPPGDRLAQRPTLLGIGQAGVVLGLLLCGQRLAQVLTAVRQRLTRVQAGMPSAEELKFSLVNRQRGVEYLVWLELTAVASLNQRQPGQRQSGQHQPFQQRRDIDAHRRLPVSLDPYRHRFGKGHGRTTTRPGDAGRSTAWWAAAWPPGESRRCPEGAGW